MAVANNEPIFVMHGARAAVTGGMLHIEEQVKALELAVAQNTGLAFDLAKTLVESACKTIITERGSVFDKDDDLPKLFKTVSSCVPFLPVALAADAGARKSLQQTLNGLNTALQGVCELRNAFGFASHGSDGPRPVMEGIQALLVAQAADAIIGFLYRVHRQDLSRPRWFNWNMTTILISTSGSTSCASQYAFCHCRRIGQAMSCSAWTRKPIETS